MVTKQTNICIIILTYLKEIKYPLSIKYYLTRQIIFEYTILFSVNEELTNIYKLMYYYNK